MISVGIILGIYASFSSASFSPEMQDCINKSVTLYSKDLAVQRCTIDLLYEKESVLLRKDTLGRVKEIRGGQKDPAIHLRYDVMSGDLFEVTISQQPLAPAVTTQQPLFLMFLKEKIKEFEAVVSLDKDSLEYKKTKLLNELKLEIRSQGYLGPKIDTRSLHLKNSLTRDELCLILNGTPNFRYYLAKDMSLESLRSFGFENLFQGMIRPKRGSENTTLTLGELFEWVLSQSTCSTAFVTQ